MNTYNAACVSIFQKFHIEIEDEVRLSGGNGEFQLSILERQLVMYQYQLKALVDDTLKLIIQTQRDTNREFVPTICNSMIPAYHYCSNESGIGSFARMKDYVHTHVIYNKETLFKQGSQRVTELLNKLIAETGERLRTAGLAVYEVMKRDYQMLGNPGAMGVMGINGYGTRELSRVLGAVENEFREVLGLARVKEQEDEVDQEMRQAVDFENMVRRQHIAVGLAPQG